MTSYREHVAANKAGVDLKHCAFENSDSICGKSAVWRYKMPKGIPDMPLCAEHYKYANANWDKDVLAAIMDIVRNNGA